MRIHTALTWSELYDVARASGAPISFHTCEEKGSRTHARAFELRLEGTGGRNNTGQYGAGDYDGATWDEWGAFFGALYAADAGARCGGTAKRPTYANAAHYHFVTGDRFRGRMITTPAGVTRRTYLPEDTHPRHGWIYLGTWGDHGAAGYKCRKCSATRPGWKAEEDYRRDNNI